MLRAAHAVEVLFHVSCKALQKRLQLYMCFLRRPVELVWAKPTIAYWTACVNILQPGAAVSVHVWQGT